jgi:LAGLIDADG endonuclease
VSGFTQSDGSFSVLFDKVKRVHGLRLPVRPRPVFTITQSLKELDMLIAIQKFLGVGTIQINEERNVANLTVRSLDDIFNVILPLFDTCKVRGGKYKSYLIFKEVVLMMKDDAHLTLYGTLLILELSYFMNKDTSLRSTKSKLELINSITEKSSLLPIEVNNFKIELKNRLDSIEKTFTSISLISKISLDFIIGLIDGDGSFNISFHYTRKRIVVNFTVIQDLASIPVLEELKIFLNCGTVYRLPSAAARFQVENIDSILTNIYPIFKNETFNTEKFYHFNIMIKVCEIIKNEGYKDNKNLQKIVDLAYNMNNNGKNRKYSKEAYLER